MGTRSITRIIDDGKPILAMYRQWDGYPWGHGADLQRFLEPMTVINGMRMDEETQMGRLANGAGCLAAQLIAHFKTEVGSIYCVSLDPEETQWVDYVYDVAVAEDGAIEISVDNGPKMTVAEFGTWCDNEGNEE